MRVNYRHYRHHSRGYITSLSVTGAIVAAGILGSVTGVVDAASHQGHFTQPTVIRHQKDNSKQAAAPSSTNNNKTPSTTAPAAQTPTATTPTPPVAASEPVTKAPVVTSQPIAPAAPPDTAVSSQTTTTAQANTDSIAKPVTYTTSQISDVLRDRLIIMAGIVGISGLLLYGLTFIKPKAPTPRNIPVRYTVPVEVVTR